MICNGLLCRKFTNLLISEMKKIILFFAAIFLTNLIFSQSRIFENPNSIPLDPKVLNGTLPNGMKYMIRHNNVPENRAEFYLVLNAGAVLEDDKQNGLAHFTEHMAFNGTKNFPGKKITNFMAENGVAFGHNVNAYTTQDITCFKLSAVPVVSEGLIDTSLLILHDWSGCITFDPKEIDAERKVIHEEWRTRQNAGFRLRMRTVDAIFNNSKYAKRNVIGDITFIDSFKHEDLLRFYNDWYRPDLQCLIIVGDIDPKDVEAKIRKIFADIPKRENAKPRTEIEIPDNDEPIIAVASDPETSEPSIHFYFKYDVEKEMNTEYFKKKVIFSLHKSMIRKRFIEIADVENSAFRLSYNSFKLENTGRTKKAFILTVKTKYDEIIKGFDSVSTEIERVRRFGFSQAELDTAIADRIREIERIYKNKDKSKTESKYFVSGLQNYFLTGEPVPGIEFNYNFQTEILPKITLEDVNNLVKERFSDKNRVIIVTAPEKQDCILPTVDEIRKILEYIKTKNIQHYLTTDTLEVSQKKLIKELPKPGKILSEKTENGITEWTFENGVRVIIKPTDFTADKISMSSFSFGGYSSVSDDELKTSRMLESIIKESGIGDFSKKELKKKLKGKHASLTIDFDKNEQGFYGHCTKTDFETMMQLTYLYATAPRIDTAECNKMYKLAIEKHNNRIATSETQFSDSIFCITNNYSPRRKLYNPEMPDTETYQKVIQIYKKKFCNASGFAYVFVGNINPDSVKQSISTYLGSLPSTGKSGMWKDEKVRPPKGVTTKKLYFISENTKSTVFIKFSGKFQYNQVSLKETEALKYILKIRFFETLREKEGGTYSVKVSTETDIFPISQYSFTITFDCAPDKADYLTKLIYQEIEKFQNDGPTASELQKTTEYFRKTREEDLKTNIFWNNLLIRKQYYGFDIYAVDNYEDILKTLTVRTLKQAACKFFTMNNRIELISTPEKG